MRSLLIAFSLSFFTSCKVETLPTNDVIGNLQFSTQSMPADGSNTVTVWVKLENDIDADKRGIVFTTINGSFVGGTGTITKKADFENGILLAKVELRAPMTPGTITLTAKPEVSSPFTDFIVKDTITATRSEPSIIRLGASAFGVLRDYAAEIRLVGLLKNAQNKNVSTETKVVFEDVFAGTNLPVNGRYREKIEVSGDSSSVSTYYSPGNLPQGTSIHLRATVLTETGARTGIKDSVIINVL